MAKQIKSIDSKEQERLKVALRRLAEEPRSKNSKRLKGSRLYRYRVGQYRIIYAIYEDRLVILVLDIVKRKQNYQNLNSLIKRYEVITKKLKKDKENI